MRHFSNVSTEAHMLRNALEDSAVAFSYFDYADHLRFWNKAYVDLNFRIRELIVDGAHFPDLLAELIARGQINLQDTDSETWLHDRLEARRYGSTGFRRLADGRTMLVQERKDTAGGTLGFWLDASDLFRADTESATGLPVDCAATSLADAGRQTLIRDKLQIILGNLEMLRFVPLDSQDTLLIDSAIEAARVVIDTMDLARDSTPTPRCRTSNREDM